MTADQRIARAAEKIAVQNQTIGMKNDIVFVLYDKLTLYERQSTKNPNLPLRNLLYAANVYSSLTKDDNLYGSTLVKIPEPRFVTFYNGADRY